MLSGSVLKSPSVGNCVCQRKCCEATCLSGETVGTCLSDRGSTVWEIWGQNTDSYAVKGA